ncbi:hypothetical protein HNP48_002262 [Acidovorax soli]|uniref:Uncharacterized protein n=1 Tax=Acidovorax soli TaxID=592050 RepID=A0A7X0PCX2_9BURK|nr:hypothetical protein [Acidovorax soli]MBB6559595.1 hypothetical protein [Acidovorax soli]
MQQSTETELAQAGFVVGATITADMAAAVQAALSRRDEAVQAIAALEVEASALLQALATATRSISGLALPAPEVAEPLEGLLYEVQSMRERSDVLNWLRGRSVAGRGGYQLRATPEQMKALAAEPTTVDAAGMAANQLDQATTEMNALIAANRGGKPIMG